MNKKSNGFTLIELLIVIAIIGILSSVVLASLNSARLKARNIARISELVQVKKALELYYDDYGAYPYTGTDGSWYTDCSGGWGASQGTNPNNIIPGLVPKYMTSISSDPTLNTASSESCTIYISDGKDYKFFLWNMRDPSPGATWFDYSGYPTFRDSYWDSLQANNCVVDGDGKDNTGSQAWQVSTEDICVNGVIY